jgi:magnesium and cobalt exporter, CNNM family
VLANGFFVATEFALVSVRRTRMQQLAAEGDRRASSVLQRLDHLDTYIAATQLGITIASLGLGWLGEPAVSRLIAPALAWLPGLSEQAREAAVHTVSFILAFSLITALHIVIGELAPKSLALQRPEQMALVAAGPIHVFEIVFRPVIALLNGVGNAVVRAVGIEPAAGHALVQSADELRLAVDASREAGLVEESAQELVDRAFLFSDLDARQVMTPRTEMDAVPATASFDEVLAAAIASGHSRLPVYEGDLDHVVGVVDVKRLLPRLAAERSSPNGHVRLTEPFDVRAVMGEVLAVPETAPASELLGRLRQAGAPIAIVIDEFGGTAGLVTLADLVEDLIGDIEVEFDAATAKNGSAADGSFSLDGLTTIVEAKEFYDLDLDADGLDVDTVGGYVFSWLGRPAAIGDQAPTADDRVLVVEDLDGLRVAQVRVLPAREAPEAETVR